MDDRTRHWNDVYRTKDDTAVSWHEDEPRVSLSLVDRAGLASDARIVDVGAGASRLVDRLLERGYRDITLLDLSDAALNTVWRRLPPDAPVRTVAADVLDWTPPAPIAAVIGPSFRPIASARHSHMTLAGAERRIVFSLFRRS
jgi:trans-aconitate methyltransferase